MSQRSGRNASRAVVLMFGLVWWSGCTGTMSRQAPERPVGMITREEALADFDSAWSRIATTYYDSTFRGLDWPGVRAELRPRAARARTRAELRSVIREMLDRIGDSHFGLFAREVVDLLDPEHAAAAARVAGEAGLELRLVEDQLVVERVRASSQGGRALDIRPGWIVDGIGEWDLASAMAAAERMESDAARQAARFRIAKRAESMLIGEAGSTLRLRLRDEQERLVAVELTRTAREGIPVRLGNLPAVFAELEHRRIPMGTDCIGIIRFNVWMTVLVPQFERAMDALSDCSGVVLDLRGNGGGTGGMAGGIAGFFLDRAAVLGVEHRRTAELRYTATRRRSSSSGEPRAAYGGSVAILVDPLTASTSEIFAVGMQQIGRARVFGERSSGKVLPALFVRLPSQDVLYHAVGNFFGPDGERIEGRGTLPDEVVPLRRADLLASRDVALEAALRWIAAEPEARSARTGLSGGSVGPFMQSRNEP
jgi:carboxyl-terminal processing protease